MRRFWGNARALAALCAMAASLAGCDGDGSRPATDGAPEQGPVADHGLPLDGPPGGEGPSPSDQGGGPDGVSAPTYDGKPGEFVKSAAGRTYRLMVPSGYSASTPIPLVVGFHGAGDTGSNFYAVCKAVGWASSSAGYILLVPDTKSPYNDFAVWSGNPTNDVPQMKTEMAEIIALIDEVGVHYHLDTKQIHAFGFSDGGLFAAVAGMDRADYYASLAVMGYGWGSGYPIVTPPRKIAVQFVVGAQDQFASYAQSSEAYLKTQGHPTRILVAAGVGHSFSGLTQQYPATQIFGWMQQHPLP